MALHVNSLTFDAADPAALAAFWATVFEADVTSPNPFVSLVDPVGGPKLMFISNGDQKRAKNRCHLDLHADDIAAVEAEVRRLVAAGATEVETHEEHGVHWTTLRDPEGNELCVGTPLPGHG